MDDYQLSKFFAGELKLEEKTSLLASLHADEEQLDEAATLKNSWAAAQLAEATGDRKKAQKEWKNFHAITNRRQYFVLLRWHVAVAASLVGVIFAATLFFNMRRSSETAYHTLTVPAGQYAQLALADGSEIWLNSRSKLTYPERFTATIREIDLEGEGFFKVASDSKRPFVVRTKMLEVIATGTQFNVSAYTDDEFVATTLIEGVVKLQSPDKNIEYLMNEGQIVFFDKPTHGITAQNTDTYLQTSWINGEYQFREMTMENLFKRMERYFDITFVFNNDALKQRKFTGTFYNRQSVETILKVIEASTNMQYTVENNIVYIK